MDVIGNIFLNLARPTEQNHANYRNDRKRQIFQKMLKMLHLNICGALHSIAERSCFFHSAHATVSQQPNKMTPNLFYTKPFFPSNISDDCGPKLNPAGREAKAPNGSGSNQTSAPCQNLLAFNLSTNLHLQDLTFLVKMWNSRITIEILFPD